MATLTGAQIETAVRDLIDDNNSGLWGSNLITHIGTVQDRMWTEILDWNPYYLTTLETITGSPKLVTPGYIDLSALSNRFNRLLSLTRRGQVFYKARQQDTMIEANLAVVAPNSTYTFLGRQIWLFPLSITDQIEMRYNYLPTKFAASGSSIIWPEGHEGALIWECAASLITKGVKEDGALLAREAEKYKYSMLAAIGRPDNSPVIPYDYGSNTEWGGV